MYNVNVTNNIMSKKTSKKSVKKPMKKKIETTEVMTGYAAVVDDVEEVQCTVTKKNSELPEFVTIVLDADNYTLPDATYVEKGYEMSLEKSHAEKFVETGKWKIISF